MKADLTNPAHLTESHPPVELLTTACLRLLWIPIHIRKPVLSDYKDIPADIVTRVCRKLPPLLLDVTDRFIETYHCVY